MPPKKGKKGGSTPKAKGPKAQNAMAAALAEMDEADEIIQSATTQFEESTSST